MTRISSALPFTLPSFGANRPVRVQAGGAPMRDNFFSLGRHLRWRDMTTDRQLRDASRGGTPAPSFAGSALASAGAAPLRASARCSQRRIVRQPSAAESHACRVPLPKGGDRFGGLHLPARVMWCVHAGGDVLHRGRCALVRKDRLSGFAVERTAVASGCRRRLQAGEHLRSDAIDCTGDGPQAKTGLACFETACGLCAGMLGKEWNTGTGEAA